VSRERFALAAAAVGVAGGLALTFPLPLQLGRAVLEDGSYDAFQFLWNVWWVRESLVALRTNPFYTRYLFYPEGVPLLFHTFSFALGLASVPLQLTFGLVAAHNLLVIAAPALSVLFAALLAREVVDDPWAALTAGLVAAVNPIAVWFLPVLYLNCGWLIAAVLWAWWRMQRLRRTRDVAAALGLLVALVFASQEFAMIALALVALDVVLRLVAPRLFGLERPWARGTLAFWGLAGGGLGALAAAALAAPAAPPPPSHVMVASGYVSGLLSPPWLAPPPARFWTILYLGTVPLLLALAALVRPQRRLAVWLLSFLLPTAMALGPYLHLHNPFPDLRLPPGGPKAEGVPGPYLLVARWLPLVRFFRAPYRWIVGAQVALAVVSALGLAGLRAAIVRPGTRAAATALALTLVVAGGALDTRGLRAPLASAAIPAAYDGVRADPDPAAILELPSGLVAGTFAAFTSRWMYYQTAHRKFLLEGTVSRLPPGRRLVIGREITDFASLPWVKYVAIHRDALPAALPAARAQAERVEAVARTQGELVAADGELAIYRLRTFRREAVL